MSATIASLALLISLYPQQQAERSVEIVNEIVRAIGSGTPVNSIDGIPAIENSAELEALKDCDPSLRGDSTLQFMHVEFRCESGENPYLRTATFIFEDHDLSFIHLSSVSGIGPTAAALGSDDLPSERSQFLEFASAIQNSGDISVGGLVPIAPEQELELRILSSCAWRISAIRAVLRYAHAAQSALATLVGRQDLVDDMFP